MGMDMDGVRPPALPYCCVALRIFWLAFEPYVP